MSGAGLLRRRLVLCALAAGVFVTAFMWWLEATNRGYFPLALRPGPSSGTLSVVVKPDSDAAKVGLRAGDVVDLRAMTPADRYQLLWSAGRNAHITLAVRRGPQLVRLPLAARWLQNVLVRFFMAVNVWMMLGAFVLLWRGWTNELARRLALILAACGFTDPFWATNPHTGIPVLDMMLAATIGACFAALGGLAIAWTLRLFGPAKSLLERSLFVSFIVLELAFIVGESLTALNGWFAFTDGHAWWMWPNGMWLGILSAVCLILLALFATRIQSVSGPARSRLIWLAVAICPWLVAMCVSPILAIVLPASGLFLADLAFIWMPIGLTYGAFGRRLLDLGFVVNRVAVYTGVSAIVVGIFVVAEYLLTDVLGASRNANVAIGAGVALFLGLSMRFIHRYVDGFLDNVFFRKRHEDEQALRAFAHEASFISDPKTVLDRARAIVERCADASSVDFALHDGNGRYGAVDEDDPAIVSLRAWRKPLDLQNIDSQMQGEFAYPMFARGRMVGVLAVGPKRSGESYAPDESKAIAELAHGVGLALDTLSTQQTNHTEMIAAIREAVSAALASPANGLHPPTMLP